MSRQRKMEKILESEYVSIGELVRITGCRYSTLKYYTQEGLLLYKQEEENLTRRYERVGTVHRIEEILSLRESGRSMAEIKERYHIADSK